MGNPNSDTLMALAEGFIQSMTHRFKFRRSLREDAEQTARLALLVALPKFDPARGGFASFAKTVIRNALIDFRRTNLAHDRKFESTPPDDEPPAPAGGECSIIDSILENPRAFLSESKAHLLEVLFVTDDRQELADWLGISVDLATQRISRLRHDLRELVG